MTNRTTVRAGGLALVVGAIAFMAVFGYLADRFDYPDVLDGRADVVAGARYEPPQEQLKATAIPPICKRWLQTGQPGPEMGAMLGERRRIEDVEAAHEPVGELCVGTF